MFSTSKLFFDQNFQASLLMPKVRKLLLISKTGRSFFVLAIKSLIQTAIFKIWASLEIFFIGRLSLSVSK